MAAGAVVIALVGYAQYWISQHPGVKFIGDGNTNTGEFITESGHYRSWPIALATLANEPWVRNAKGVKYTHDLDAIWGVKIERHFRPKPITKSELASLKKYLVWSPSEEVDSGWISGIYFDSSGPAVNPTFTAYVSPERKIYLIHVEQLAGSTNPPEANFYGDGGNDG